MKIIYNKNLKQFSRNLRNHSTLAEILLWNQIKGKKIKGYQFCRQRPIGNYIVDFYCNKLNLIIEIDGSSHTDLDKDNRRQNELENLGYNFIRFYDSTIKQNLNGAIDYLVGWIKNFEKNNPRLKPPPLQRGI